jgi:hypothetical protein
MELIYTCQECQCCAADDFVNERWLCRECAEDELGLLLDNMGGEEPYLNDMEYNYWDALIEDQLYGGGW